MATSFKLQALTPEKTLFEGEVISISLPGGYGYMEILADHADIISLVQEGNIVITSTNQEKTQLTSSAGFFQMKENKAILLLK